MAKHKESFNKKKVELVSLVSFLMGFSQSLIAYVLSSYVQKITGKENYVGIVYFVAYIFVLFCFLNLHRVIRRIGKSRVFIFAVFFKIITVTFLILSPSDKISILFVILYTIFGGIEWTAMDIILESFSKDRMSGRIRGLHLMIINAGFILGPFLSAFLLKSYDYQTVFTYLLIFNMLVFFFALVGLRQVSYSFTKKIKIIEMLQKVGRRKNIQRIFYASFALDFFYALMIIYTPLYLLDLGFSWDRIGLIFTAMLVPFILIQYPAGVLADKKYGEKEFIISALLIMGISTLAVFFSFSTSVFYWMVLLFVTRIGAALLEVMRDSYFFKRIDCDDVDLIDFFRSSSVVAYIVSTGLISILFIVFKVPIRYAFIVIALVVFSAILPAAMLQDNKAERELEN
jgi:MFS family permease